MVTLVIDTSAIVAMLFGEVDAQIYAMTATAADDLRMSSVTDYETRIVLGSRGAAMLKRYSSLLEELAISIVDFDAEQSRFAADVYRRWGKGNHTARLNMGDCAAYALAKSLEAPLLFKGADFARTDVKRAL